VTSPTDLSGVDPLLGPLSDNNGPTYTHAFLSGSPAIGVGSCTDIGGNAITPDQRGISRPQWDGCNMGAYESEQAPVVTFPPTPPVLLSPTDGAVLDINNPTLEWEPSAGSLGFGWHLDSLL